MKLTRTKSMSKGNDKNVPFRERSVPMKVYVEGKRVLIDDEDKPFFDRYKWTWVGDKVGVMLSSNHTYLFFHREILHLPKTGRRQNVAFFNRDTSDCRKANLLYRDKARREHNEQNRQAELAIARTNNTDKKRRWREAHPEKANAHNVVGNAVRDGKLVPKPCELCGATPTQAHHVDYADPVDVLWLCQKHHPQADKERRKNFAR